MSYRTTGKAKDVSEAYKNKTMLVRPHFCEFIKTARARFADVMIFVYTASEKNWASKEIGWIEKQCGISFDRPIFSREDCIQEIGSGSTKSVLKIFPKLKKATKNRL
eukprot:763077-Hanusia_phi.AAC.5